MMSQKRMILNIILIFSIFLSATGCATKGGLITSLEDLATESSKEGFSKVPQYRVISVPGLLPFAEPGSLQFYKPQRKPSSAIGLSNGNSYVMQTVIDSKCDEKCLSSIRNNLISLRSSAEALVEDRINLTRIIAAAPPNGSDSSTISTFTKSVDDAQKKYSKAREDFDTNHQKVLNAINSTGILIYRWNSNSKRSGALGLGEIFGTSGSNNETYSGFALVSGLRTATLYLGRDLVDSWKNLDTKSNYSNRFELTTYVMQAKHIIYITEYDLQSMLNAKLKASYAQMKNIPDTVKGLDQIEINFALAKIANLSNMGVIGESKRTTRQVDWKKPSGILKVEDLDGWQTFYSVESDLTDLIEVLQERKQ